MFTYNTDYENVLHYSVQDYKKRTVEIVAGLPIRPFLHCWGGDRDKTFERLVLVSPEDQVIRVKGVGFIEINKQGWSNLSVLKEGYGKHV